MSHDHSRLQRAVDRVHLAEPTRDDFRHRDHRSVSLGGLRADDAQRPRRGPQHPHRRHRSAELQRADGRLRGRRHARSNGNQYIVNGFPYGGMGFGFNPATGSLARSSACPLALTPNAPPSGWGRSTAIIPGGVNSDYTAPDYQDPLLALAVPNPNRNGGILVPIPSLHRSDLIAYRQWRRMRQQRATQSCGR